MEMKQAPSHLASEGQAVQPNEAQGVSSVSMGNENASETGLTVVTQPENVTEELTGAQVTLKWQVSTETSLSANGFGESPSNAEYDDGLAASVETSEDAYEDNEEGLDDLSRQQVLYSP